MTSVPTWTERCNRHPDHQSGMVSHGMIQARMQEEIDDLRAENEQLRSQVSTLKTAVTDAAKVVDKLWRERDRAQAKVERSRVKLREIMLISRGICGEIESGRDSSLMGDKP